MRHSLLVLCIFLMICLIPVSSLAAGDEAGGWGWFETLGRWINILILFGGILYFTRQPIGEFFRGRRRAIQKQLEAAKEARGKAEAELAQMEERMAGLDAELESLRNQAESEAERERKRILSEAEVEAAKIVAAAQREIEGLTRAARQDLKEYASGLSVELARERIESEMTDKTEEKIIDSFIVKLKAEHGEKA